MLLERMRKGVSKIVIQILALLLIASFALWGVGDMVGVISNPDEIATVDGNRISSREYREQLRRVMANARRVYGDIDLEQARDLGLADTALDSMLSRRLLEFEAGDLGVAVADELVVRRIRREPAFRNESGSFDRASYQAVLANNGMSEAGYVESVRNDLRRQFLTDAMGAGVGAPDLLADMVYRFRNERRTAEFVSVARKPAKDVPEPSDGEVAGFFAENEGDFMAPEFRSLVVLYLDPAEVAKEMEPDPESVREEYESRRASLEIPERRRIEQIIVQSEDAARELHRAFTDGAEFGVKQAGDSARMTTLGPVSRSELPETVAEAAFALEKDGLSGPVQTPFGWHIVRVTEITPGRTPPFDEVKDGIRDDLAKELALDDLVGRGNRIEDVLAGGGTIEEAAAEAGIRATTVEAIDARRSSPDGKPVAGLPADPEFLETAFAAGEGETSALIDTADGGYFVLRVDGVTASAKRPLSEVRDDVVKAWRADRADKEARETADSVLKAVQDGATLESAAGTRGLKVVKAGPFNRSGEGDGAGIPSGAVADLFAAAVGEHVLSETGSGYVVARVAGVESAELDRESDGYKRLRDGMAEGFRSGLVEEYVRALRMEHEVEVNTAAYDAVFDVR